jgi:crossover junction endodeoxyribonuclease RusA
MLALDLPWPSPDLSPNARVHWAKKARAAKKARSLAGWTAVQHRQMECFKNQQLLVSAIFSPPDGRPRDTDNMLASVKPYFDGIADVIGVDDSKWQLAIQREEPRPLGNVRIQIEVIE